MKEKMAAVSALWQEASDKKKRKLGKKLARQQEAYTRDLEAFKLVCLSV